MLTVRQLFELVEKGGSYLIRVGKGAGKRNINGDDYVWENPNVNPEDPEGYAPNDPIWDLEVAEIHAYGDDVIFETK